VKNSTIGKEQDCRLDIPYHRLAKVNLWLLSADTFYKQEINLMMRNAALGFLVIKDKPASSNFF
jgi:hypothetical protein